MAFSDKPLSGSLFACFAAICFVSVTGITVDLIHTDSPNSPFYNPSQTRFERLQNSIQLSNIRYSFLKSSILQSGTTPQGIRAPVFSGRGIYLMKIKIGTPPVDTVAIADTGSDLTWTQCQPCTQCFKQDAPLFDPRKSSTFQPALCSDRFCRALGSMADGCDIENRCKYEIFYGDRSYTKGNLAKDTFLFESSSGNGSQSFPSVAFGCGTEDKGTFIEKTSGIVGLGGGATSVIRQLDKAVGGRFSYCLTPVDSNVSSTISFGHDAAVSGRGLLKTPLFPRGTFYSLKLEGISVGNKRISYKPRTPQKTGGVGNIIIDSGTTLTYLPSHLYVEIVAELKKAVKGTPATDKSGSLEVCYKSEGLTVPPITVHFTGADVELSKSGTFVEISEGVVCAAFTTAEMPIFGNLHQIDYLIGYDIRAQELSFLPTDCSRRR